jgi:hypothetical protein
MDEGAVPYNSRRLLNRTGSAVAIGMVTLLGIAIILLYFVEIPKDNNNVLLVLLGSLATAVSAIVQWFFGGSLAGTRAKSPDPQAPGTATMTASATIATDPTPATPQAGT